MNETLVEKIEARHDYSKAWRLANKENGHYIDVTFNIDLEHVMREHRNFSFARFVSEQLNELSKLTPSLTKDYTLTIDQEAVAPTYLPLTTTQAEDLLTLLD